LLCCSSNCNKFAGRRWLWPPVDFSLDRQKKTGPKPRFFIAGKELLLFFDGGLGSVNDSGSGSINSSRGGGSVSRSSRGGSSVSRSSSRGGSSVSRSSSRGSLFLNDRGRSGNNGLFLLTASGQAKSDQSSNENRLVHEISLSTRSNKIRINIFRSAWTEPCKIIAQNKLLQRSVIRKCHTLRQITQIFTWPERLSRAFC
jgi:hypothetical protein